MICPFSIIQKLQSFVFLNGIMEMNRLFHDILIFWKGSVTTEQKSNESQTSPTTPAKLRSKELKLPLIIIPFPPTCAIAKDSHQRCLSFPICSQNFIVSHKKQINGVFLASFQ